MLSPNQIRANARQFSLEWKDETRERAESQTFWNEFLAVFGVNRRKVGIFEATFKKLKGTQGFIDVYWPKKLVCEQKSRGADLDKATKQALDYLQSIAKVAEDDLPRYVIVCDFERLHLFDLALGFSNPVKVEIPAGITATADKNIITITGIDKETVGQFSAHVRSLKKPEPYKGKGFRYDGEVIRRKQGKKSA